MRFNSLPTSLLLLLSALSPAFGAQSKAPPELIPAAGLLDGLRSRLEPAQVLSRGEQSLLNAAVFDQASRGLIVLNGYAGFETWGVGPQGELASERSVARAAPDAALVFRSMLDEPSRTLITTGWDGLKTRPVDAAGQVGPVRQFIRTDLSWNGALDQASRLLLTLTGDTESRIAGALLRLAPDGTIDPRPRQFLEKSRFGPLARGAFDPATRSLISIDDRGSVAVRRLSPEGVLSPEPIQRFKAYDGELVYQFLFDPGTRALIIAGDPGRPILAYRSSPAGVLETKPYLAIPARDKPNSAAIDPVSRSLYLVHDHDIRRYSLDPPPLEIAAGSEEGEAAALARKFMGTTGEEWREAAGILRGAAQSAGLPWVHRLWSQVMRAEFPAAAAPTLSQAASSRQWYRGSEAAMKRRLPALWRTLQEPERLGRLLFGLSLLRTIFPYDLASFSELAPLAWAREKGLEFDYEGLKVVPVSESFRRHIIYGTDARGIAAVELKIPGDLADRNLIQPSHFSVARQLWDEFGRDAGTARPVFFGRWRGAARMYGRTLDFDASEPLGVMVFDYQDGKRLRNAKRLLEAAAEREGLSYRQAAARTLADAAVTAIRLHRLGWRGNNGQGGVDMHDENVRVLPEGKAVFAGDFGAFERVKLSPAARGKETRELLDFDDELGESFLEEVYPLVVKKLTRGLKDRAEIARVRKEVRAELGLK